MTTVQITREAHPASAVDATPAHQSWEIHHDGQAVAELHVADVNGEILWAWTHEGHRERGHAAALYQQAHTDLAGRIFHAPEGHRTDDGDRFAARVGGETLTCTCCHFDDTDDDYCED